MRRTYALALAVALTAGRATAQATTDPAAIRERAEAYLGAIDRPVPASAWKALGPDAIPVLEELLQTDPIASRRAGAAAGLAAIGGDRAVAALQKAAQQESERWSVRAAAVKGLGVAVAPGALPAALKPVLERAGTSEVRGLAADVLARHAPQAGCAAVRQQLQRETAAGKAAFARAAARCGSR